MTRDMEEEIERIIRVCMQHESMCGTNFTAVDRFNVARDAREAILDRINGFGKPKFMPGEKRDYVWNRLQRD
jgi:hypothetical protein